MDVFDPNKAAAIWARVYANEGAQPPAEPKPSAPNAPPELYRCLPQMIAAEQRATADGYHLARLSGEAAPQLRRMAQQHAAHVRRLSALYFLLTGRQSAPPPYAAGLETELPAMLSARYRAEVESAAVYRRTAAQYPDHAALFTALAQEETAHAAQLLSVTEQRLFSAAQSPAASCP